MSVKSKALWIITEKLREYDDEVTFYVKLEDDDPPDLYKLSSRYAKKYVVVAENGNWELAKVRRALTYGK